MLKRKIALALIASQCILCVTGCGKNGEENSRSRLRTSTSTIETGVDSGIDNGTDGAAGEYVVRTSGLMNCLQLERASKIDLENEKPGKVFEMTGDVETSITVTQYYKRGNMEESADYYTEFFDSLDSYEYVSEQDEVTFVPINYSMHVSDYDGEVWRNWTFYELGYVVYGDYDAEKPLSEQNAEVVTAISRNYQRPINDDDTEPRFKYFLLSEGEFDSYKGQYEDDLLSDNEGVVLKYKEKNEEYYAVTDSYPKDEIVLLSYYANYAWGTDISGVFVDSNGYMYSFELSNHETFNFSTDLMDILYYEVYYKKAPFAQVDKDYLNIILESEEDINYNANWVEKSVACDAGSTYIATVNDRNYRGIICSGDWERYLDNDGAKKTVELINNIGSYVSPL